MLETEAAHGVHRRVERREDRAGCVHEVGRGAVHPELLVGVPEVGNLEDLRLVLEREPPVGPEEARVSRRPLVPVAVEDVATVAVVEAVDRQLGAADVVRVERRARSLLRRERVVEVANRVRRVGDLQREGREVGHVRRAELGRVADEAGERDVERVEGVHLVEDPGARLRRDDRIARAVEERNPRLLDGAVPIAAPVHRAGVVEAAQALGGHRPLDGHVVAEHSRGVRRSNEGSDGRLGDREHVGLLGVRGRDGERNVAGVAEIPREAVEVAADVAAGARLVAERRGLGRVVEELAPLEDARRLGIEHRHVRGLPPRVQVDDRDRVVEAGEHERDAVPLAEDDARGASAREEHLIRARRGRAPRLERGRVVDGQLAGPLRDDVELLAVVRDGEVLREGSTQRRVARTRRVIEV